jgi:hypothetical protein
MRLRWLPLALLAACSDPTDPSIDDPCAPVFACRSAGVDLETVSVDIASTATDPATGLPIVYPPGVPVEVTIRNRGTDTAAAGFVQVNLGNFFSTGSISYPALPPGASHRGSVTLPIPADGASGLRDDRMTIETSVWAEHDTISENNQMLSGPIHVAIPLLDITFTTVADAVAGQPIDLKVLARNYGRHAASPARELSACLYDGFRSCDPGNRTTAGSLTIPAIAPGAAEDFVATMTLTPTGVWQDAAGHYDMYLCTAGMYKLPTGWSCFSNARSITVRPSYDVVCAPPVLNAAATSLSAYNCGLRPVIPAFEEETQRYRFHIVALEVQSGVGYVLQRSDTTAVVRVYNSDGDVVYDYDPDPERIRVASTEKLYLVMYSATPTLTISATPEVGQ